MATQYFRITVYHPAEDLSAIFDSNGRFEKLWQFSSFLLGRGCKIIEASSDEKFLDGNITKTEPDTVNLIARAYNMGKPENTTYEVGGVVYHAVKVGDKLYIPDRKKTGGAV